MCQFKVIPCLLLVAVFATTESVLLLVAGQSTVGSRSISDVSSGESEVVTPIPPTPVPPSPEPPTPQQQLSMSSSGVLSPGQDTAEIDDEQYQNLFNSPFYNDSDSLISAKSTALGAAFISGVSGNPLNSVHIARSTTLLGICKPWENRPLPLSQLPFVLAIGEHGTRYYAGAATINPLFLLVFTGVNALVCFSFGKAVAKSFSEARRKLRFPNTVVFPYVFLIQPSTMCALTVLLNSDDIPMMVTASFSMLWWVVSIPMLAYFIHKKVPPNTRYVENYRHETLDSKAQKKLLNAVMEIDSKRREREAERERLREDSERKIERESSIGTRLKTGTTGMLTQLAGIFATMARDEEEEARLRREEEERRRREAEEDSDEEMLDLIEKQAQFEYARMLSTTLDDTSLDDESALSIVLGGNDRWVDFAHNDEEENDDNIETIDVDGIHDSIGFVRKHGLVFARYKQRFKFFCLCELTMSLACGLLEGWRPTDPSFSACVGPSIAMMVLFGCYFSAILVIHPSISTFEHIFNVIISGLQFIASILVVVAIFQEVLWAQVTTYVLAVICIYLCALKSLVDLYAVLAPYFATESSSWNTIKPLTRSYLETAEDSKRKRDERSKRKRRLTRFKKAPAPGGGDDPLEETLLGEEENLVELVETSPSQQPQTDDTPPPASTTDSQQQLVVPEVIAGDPLPPTQEGEDGDDDPNKKLQAVEELVGEERTLSMNNRFRASRGVPDVLHPYVQRPLPPTLPLPVRSTEESKRRHELLAKSKRKEYWSSTLAGVFDGGAEKKETPEQAPAPAPDPEPSLLRKESMLSNGTADSDSMMKKKKSSAWIKAEAVTKMMAPPKRRKRGQTVKDQTKQLLGLAGLNTINFEDEEEDGDDEGADLAEHDDALAMEEGGLLELDYDDRNDPEKVATVARKKREAKLQRIFGVGHNRQVMDKPAWADAKAVTNMNQASFVEARLAAEEEKKKASETKADASSAADENWSKVKKSSRFYKIMDTLMLENKADEDQREKRKKLGDDGKGTSHDGVRGTLTADNIQIQALLEEKSKHPQHEGSGGFVDVAGTSDGVLKKSRSQQKNTVPAFAKGAFDINLNDSGNVDSSVPIGGSAAKRRKEARPDIAVVGSGVLYPTTKTNLKNKELALPTKPSQYFAQRTGEASSTLPVEKKKTKGGEGAADDLDEFFFDRSNSPVEDESPPPPEAELSPGDKQKSSTVLFDKQPSTTMAVGETNHQDNHQQPQTNEEVTAREVWGALVSGRQRGREKHLEETLARQGSSPGGAFAHLSSNADSQQIGPSGLRRQNTAALSQRNNSSNTNDQKHGVTSASSFAPPASSPSIYSNRSHQARQNNNSSSSRTVHGSSSSGSPSIPSATTPQSASSLYRRF